MNWVDTHLQQDPRTDLIKEEWITVDARNDPKTNNMKFVLYRHTDRVIIPIRTER